MKASVEVTQTVNIEIDNNIYQQILNKYKDLINFKGDDNSLFEYIAYIYLIKNNHSIPGIGKFRINNKEIRDESFIIDINFDRLKNIEISSEVEVVEGINNES